MAAVIAVNGSNRPVNFVPSPSLWGDQFTKYKSDPQVKEKYCKEIEELKNEVRNMLTTPGSKMVDTMNLIETIERLGVSYHFKNQIEEMIQEIFNLNTDYKDEAYDLYTVALHFRLFRQHGHPISSDIFCKWTDENGKFQEGLKSDAKGLLSLYEASHLRIHGETLLDEALDFATANLKSMAPNLRSPLKKQVEHALVQSLHFGLPRIEARHFISIYEEEKHKNGTLLRFAKLDFNLVQILHKQELRELSGWWKDLDLVSKLPYARDRLVECFFWSVGVFYEPQYSGARIMLAKAIIMTSILDDTFDSYGTIAELEILTEAIQRWDIKETDRLPEYMKAFYKALLKLYQHFAEGISKDGRAYATHYAIESLKELTRSYYVEAKWFIQGYVPTFEDYLNNALVTGTSKYHTITSLLGMKSIVKKDFDWIIENPKMIVATQTITRLIDDTASYEVEKERGQVATGIECYMKEKGVTKEVAMNKFSEMATNAWKDSNEECLGFSSNSRDLFTVLVNFNRLMDVTYKNNEDGYTQPEKVLKPHIIALFVDQIGI